MEAKLWKWAAGLDIEWPMRNALVQLISDFEYGGTIFEYKRTADSHGVYLSLITRGDVLSCVVEVCSETLSGLIRANLIGFEIISDTQCQITFNYKDEAE